MGIIKAMERAQTMYESLMNVYFEFVQSRQKRASGLPELGLGWLLYELESYCQCWGWNSNHLTPEQFKEIIRYLYAKHGIEKIQNKLFLLQEFALFWLTSREQTPFQTPRTILAYFAKPFMGVQEV